MGSVGELSNSGYCRMVRTSWSVIVSPATFRDYVVALMRSRMAASLFCGLFARVLAGRHAI
jgi:hypothetical protein